MQLILNQLEDKSFKKMVDYRIVSKQLMEKISNFRNYFSLPYLLTSGSKKEYRKQVDAAWQEIAEMFPDHLATPIPWKPEFDFEIRVIVESTQNCSV
jgi:hypothetical protein